MSVDLVTAHWNPVDLGSISTGVDGSGARLPSKAWMALRRLGWTAKAPVGVWVSDRVRRVAEEHAARLLRLTGHRELILQAITATWPAGPRRTPAEWTALRSALPVGPRTSRSGAAPATCAAT